MPLILKTVHQSRNSGSTKAIKFISSLIARDHSRLWHGMGRSLTDSDAKSLNHASDENEDIKAIMPKKTDMPGKQGLDGERYVGLDNDRIRLIDSLAQR